MSTTSHLAVLTCNSKRIVIQTKRVSKGAKGCFGRNLSWPLHEAGMIPYGVMLAKPGSGTWAAGDTGRVATPRVCHPAVWESSEMLSKASHDIKRE